MLEGSERETYKSDGTISRMAVRRQLFGELSGCWSLPCCTCLKYRESSQITGHQVVYRSGAKHGTIVQYLLLVFNILEVLKGPVHESNKLETSNCISGHNEP
jgi:hypothetical protein